MKRKEIIKKVEEKIIFIGGPEKYKDLNFHEIILAGLKRYYPKNFSIYENGDNLLVVEKLNNEENKN